MLRFLLRCGLIVAIGFSRVSGIEAAAIKGRVVDSTGKPIAGAEVRMWQKLPAREGQGISNQQTMFDGRDILVTDDEGRFATPDVLVEEAFARIVVEDVGMLAGRSGWIEIGKDAKEAMVAAPDIVLERLTAVVGKVVDRRGQPVAGVTVFSSGDGNGRVEAITGQSGKFLLRGIPGGRAFVFAEKPGFRFTGMGLPTSKREAAFTLTAIDEPVEAVATLPPALSDGEQTALARTLLDGWLDKSKQSGTGGFWVIRSLAEIDPLDAYNRVREMHIPQARARSDLELVVLSKCVERRDLVSWDDLRTLIESSEDPSWHSGAFVWAAQRMNASEEPRRHEWLAQGLLQARRIEQPAERAQSLVVVAAGLYDAGDGQQADEIISEAEEIAEQLPEFDRESQQTFRMLALNLAKRDPARGMAWLERIKRDYPYVNDGGDLAVKLLPEHPDAAEETWDRTTTRLDGDWHRCHMGVRGLQLANFCYRLAGINRLRAEQIARDTHVQPLRVRGLAAVALRLASSDTDAARKLLVQIIRDELPRPELDDDFDPFGFPGLAAPLTAAWLLPIAERIDPQLGRECFWRSLALRAARPRLGQLDDEAAEIDIRLTMMLSRYDRDIARALLRPLVARLPELEPPAASQLNTRHAIGVAMNCRSLERTIISAAVHIDPLWAVEILDKLPQPEPPASGGFDVVEALVNTLSRRGPNRWGEENFFSAFSANYWQPNHEPAGHESP
ncbi:MAG TPA: carboxypeptidase regulatory-like domain-containing protein [Pirellulales bacterium]